MAKRINNLAQAWSRADQEVMGHVETVFRFDDGYSFVQIKTLNMAQSEGEALQNCLRHIDEDDLALTPARYKASLLAPHNPKKLYALRDPKNQSHAIVFVDHEKGCLLESRGKQNVPPKPKYIPYVVELLDAWSLNLDRNCGNTGLLFQDGVYHDVMNLPSDFRCFGDYDISFNPQIRDICLPKVILGDLSVYDSGVWSIDAVQVVQGDIFLPKMGHSEGVLEPVRFSNLNMAKAHLRSLSWDLKSAGWESFECLGS